MRNKKPASKKPASKKPVKKIKIKSPTKGKNEVNLIGRVSSIQGEKVLPSGDKVGEFRIVISRGGKNPSFDVLDIAVWSETLRRKVRTLKSEDWLEIQGSLRRRFWQGKAGLATRWQVEAAKIRVL